MLQCQECYFYLFGNPRNNKSIHSMKGVPVLFFNSSIDAMLEELSSLLRKYSNIADASY